MKPVFYSMLFFASLVFLAGSCNNHEETPDPSGISGSLTNHSGCKNFKSGGLKFTEADTFSCVHYLYDDVTNKLIMNHINAGFNCCPEKISCEVSENNDTITIREKEKEQGCDCNCLFDLDIELNGVVQAKYIVNFIEPYAEGQEQLIFEMDLTSGNEGEYCVTRKGYPWGE
jgi:hypothetical protein